MPNLNGKELLEKVRALKTNKEFYIVLVSADVIKDSKFNMVIEKPAKTKLLK